MKKTAIRFTYLFITIIGAMVFFDILLERGGFKGFDEFKHGILVGVTILMGFFFVEIFRTVHSALASDWNNRRWLSLAATPVIALIVSVSLSCLVGLCGHVIDRSMEPTEYRSWSTRTSDANADRIDRLERQYSKDLGQQGEINQMLGDDMDRFAEDLAKESYDNIINNVVRITEEHHDRTLIGRIAKALRKADSNSTDVAPIRPGW